MYIKIFKANKIEEIRESWLKLQNSEDMTYFQSIEWNYLLINQFNRQIEKRFYRRIRYICVFDNNSLVLIAPLRIKKIFKFFHVIKEIELLGADSFSDYVNLIYGNNVKESYFDYLFDFLHKYKTGYKLVWNCIYKNTLFGKYLKKKYCYNIREYKKSIYIPSNNFANFEEYFLSLSKSTRQNFRTSCNRMKRDGLSFSFRLYGCLQNEHNSLSKEVVKRLMKLNLIRTIEKNSQQFSSKIKILKESFNLRFRNIVKDNIETNPSQWTLIAYLDNKEAGFLTGVFSNTKNCIYVMMNKVLPEFEFYSPMMTAIIKFIEYNYSIGYTGIYDFGRGTESYKYKLGGQENILLSLEMFV